MNIAGARLVRLYQFQLGLRVAPGLTGEIGDNGVQVVGAQAAGDDVHRVGRGGSEVRNLCKLPEDTGQVIGRLPHDARDAKLADALPLSTVADRASDHACPNIAHFENRLAALNQCGVLALPSRARWRLAAPEGGKVGDILVTQIRGDRVHDRARAFARLQDVLLDKQIRVDLAGESGRARAGGIAVWPVTADALLSGDFTPVSSVTGQAERGLSEADKREADEPGEDETNRNSRYGTHHYTSTYDLDKRHIMYHFLWLCKDGCTSTRAAFWLEPNRARRPFAFTIVRVTGTSLVTHSSLLNVTLARPSCRPQHCRPRKNRPPRDKDLPTR